MKKYHTTYLLIFSAIVTILAVGLFVFFYKIIENKNLHASTVLTTLQGKMKEKEDAILFAEKVAEIKSLQNSVNGYFVDSNKIDTFVNYLEDIGPNFGTEVTVKNIEIPPKTKNTIIFDVAVSGTFKGVMKTITFLENILYKVNITQIYLNKDVVEQSQQTMGTDGAIIKEKVPSTQTWQADVSFNILSLN